MEEEEEGRRDQVRMFVMQEGAHNQCAEVISTTMLRTRPLASSSRAPPSTSASAPSVSICGRSWADPSRVMVTPAARPGYRPETGSQV